MWLQRGQTSSHLSGSQPAWTQGASLPALATTRKYYLYSSKPSSQHPTLCVWRLWEVVGPKGRPSCAGLFLCWKWYSAGRGGSTQRTVDVTTFLIGLPGAEGNSPLSEMICFILESLGNVGGTVWREINANTLIGSSFFFPLEKKTWWSVAMGTKAHLLLLYIGWQCKGPTV